MWFCIASLGFLMFDAPKHEKLMFIGFANLRIIFYTILLSAARSLWFHPGMVSYVGQLEVPALITSPFSPFHFYIQ